MILELLEVETRKCHISKREEVLKPMNMVLVNAIRKLGWPDSNGHWQYGNAAVLCYLSQNNAGKQFVEQHKDMLVEDLIAQYA